MAARLRGRAPVESRGKPAPAPRPLAAPARSAAKGRHAALARHTPTRVGAESPAALEIHDSPAGVRLCAVSVTIAPQPAAGGRVAARALSRRRTPGRSGGRTSARAASRAGVRLSPSAHRTCSPRPRRADAAAVDEHHRLDVRRPVRDHEVEVGPDDERAGVQGVRRDERDHHRVEAPDEHRPAVREVVGGRPGRRGADHAVARLHAEVLAADRVLELDHPAGRAARRRPRR